jgi:hypothetical protein
MCQYPFSCLETAKCGLPVCQTSSDATAKMFNVGDVWRVECPKGSYYEGTAGTPSRVKDLLCTVDNNRKAVLVPTDGSPLTPCIQGKY